MFLDRFKLVFFLLFVLPNILFGREKRSIFQMGLHASFGTHVKRIGISAGFYHVDNHVQISLRSLLNYTLRGYGPPRRRFEWQLSEGLHYYFFAEREKQTFQYLNELNNFSLYRHGFGYTLKQYLDQSGTSQHSAMFSLRINNLVLASENDLFLFDFMDKYRSGAFLIRYEHLKVPLALHYKLQIYTGNSLCASCRRQIDTIGRFSYIIIPDEEGGTFSHGISSFEIETLFIGSNSLRFSIGTDNEKIRNLVQNKWLHDQRFLPLKWRRPNAHIPMLNSDGSLHVNNQGRIRKPKVFLQAGMNEPMFW